jgi:hypothetical protein
MRERFQACAHIRDVSSKLYVLAYSIGAHCRWIKGPLAQSSAPQAPQSSVKPGTRAVHQRIPSEATHVPARKQIRRTRSRTCTQRFLRARRKMRRSTRFRKKPGTRLLRRILRPSTEVLLTFAACRIFRPIMRIFRPPNPLDTITFSFIVSPRRSVTITFHIRESLRRRELARVPITFHIAPTMAAAEDPAIAGSSANKSCTKIVMGTRACAHARPGKNGVFWRERERWLPCGGFTFHPQLTTRRFHIHIMRPL